MLERASARTRNHKGGHTGIPIERIVWSSSRRCRGLVQSGECNAICLDPGRGSRGLDDTNEAIPAMHTEPRNSIPPCSLYPRVSGRRESREFFEETDAITVLGGFQTRKCYLVTSVVIKFHLSQYTGGWCKLSSNRARDGNKSVSVDTEYRSDREHRFLKIWVSFEQGLTRCECIRSIVLWKKCWILLRSFNSVSEHRVFDQNNFQVISSSNNKFMPYEQIQLIILITHIKNFLGIEYAWCIRYMV